LKLKSQEMKYPFEPFRIKVTEPIQWTSQEERMELLKEAGYNLFFIPSRFVLVDLLTDSGTGAMSQDQWSAIFRGDEAYAGAKSFERFEATIKEITGKRFVFPVHQGRAAEKIIVASLVEKDTLAIANTFFDTTGANFRAGGAQLLNISTRESEDWESNFPFKGNMDLETLDRVLTERGRTVSAVLMTVTNNSGGGQPVSLLNMKRVRELTEKHGVPLILDACRVAENAYFVKTREEGQSNRKIEDIVKEFFSLSDIAFMSAKKDGLANIGGFIVTDSEKLAEKFSQFLILWEGFLTYGGLAGRDLDAISVGLKEAMDENYLRYRIGQVAYLARKLRELGIPILWPPGGHAVYVDAGSWLPHIPKSQFPGQSLVVALYLEGGIRAVEIGSLMFGKEMEVKREMVRLAVPRRVYTQSHLDYVVETFEKISLKRETLKGFKIVSEPPFLRHFLSKLEPVG